jgi:hypothetical protein
VVVGDYKKEELMHSLVFDKWLDGFTQIPWTSMRMLYMFCRWSFVVDLKFN